MRGYSIVAPKIPLVRQTVRDRMARTRANDYDTKRLGILGRSAALFAAHGYTGTSITMIAEACGVSKALMYHYYSSKDAVLFDLLSDHLQHLLAVVEAASQASGDGKERLFAIAATLLEAYRGADAEHQVQIASLKLLPPAQQEILKEMERRLVALVSDALMAAIPAIAKKRHLLKPLTMSLFGMLNWHYLWFREGKGLTRDNYARMVTALILAGADEAMAAADEPVAVPGIELPTAKKKSEKPRPALAGRAV
jgi:AcrR family transcriptional regulator